MNIFIIVLVLALAGAAAFAVYLYSQLNKLKRTKKEKTLTELEAIEKASKLAKEKLVKAEKEANEIEKRANTEIASARAKFKQQERLLDEKEEKLLKRSKQLDSRLDELEEKDKEIENQRSEIKSKVDDLKLQLEKVAGLTKEEAEEILKKEVEEDIGDWITKKIKESETEIKEKSEEISKKILVDTMLNSVVDYVAETTTTTIDIEDESLKSRVIGKSGRNVRAFERLTGVDVIIDESPNEVTISCFDPIRREVAAIALKKLLKTGKINPATIEETIKKVKTEVLKEIKKTGEELAFEAGFSDIPNEVILLLGRFKYRFSHGQNLVKHTLETVKIAEALANEVGANVRDVKLACLLHDVGKVMPQDGKNHGQISADIARKYWPKSKALANAVEAHHGDAESNYIEAELVQIANKISGSRPGARRESYEDYVKRLRTLEDIANKREGVKSSYAIQAGREVRVIVNPEKISDDKTKKMAFEIAKDIESSGNYPGAVKVSVIREYRTKSEAK
ncbi:MAG: ribonuclease Y [Candidatus Dojkabacteria bacterium]|nr:ribonuclease Y [Candidatus Dojkabacteria bacterium]MDQ7020344.1 ribonuclease Y [Candidatus Dojkabacteria bacterium]